LVVAREFRFALNELEWTAENCTSTVELRNVGKYMYTIICKWELLIIIEKDAGGVVL
jgi:hypothetical protein